MGLCFHGKVSSDSHTLPNLLQQYATKDGVHFERLKLWVLYSGVEQSEGDEFDLGKRRRNTRCRVSTNLMI